MTWTATYKRLAFETVRPADLRPGDVVLVGEDELVLLVKRIQPEQPWKGWIMFQGLDGSGKVETHSYVPGVSSPVRAIAYLGCDAATR